MPPHTAGGTPRGCDDSAGALESQLRPRAGLRLCSRPSWVTLWTTGGCWPGTGHPGSETLQAPVQPARGPLRVLVESHAPAKQAEVGGCSAGPGARGLGVGDPQAGTCSGPRCSPDWRVAGWAGWWAHLRGGAAAHKLSRTIPEPAAAACRPMPPRGFQQVWQCD